VQLASYLHYMKSSRLFFQKKKKIKQTADMLIKFV
jgi:hypothetical protein